MICQAIIGRDLNDVHMKISHGGKAKDKNIVVYPHLMSISIMKRWSAGIKSKNLVKLKDVLADHFSKVLDHLELEVNEVIRMQKEKAVQL